MNTGIILNEEASVYHSSGAVGSGMLMDLEPTPALYYGRYISRTIPAPNIEAFPVGLGLHYLVESIEAFEANVVIHPPTYSAPGSKKKDAAMIDKPWNWNANACKEWAKRFPGKVILSHSEENLVDEMNYSVMQNPDAMAILRGGKAEVTFRKNLGPFYAQVRADRWHENGVTLPSTGRHIPQLIADVKSCDTIERFKRDFANLGYHIKAQYYRMVAHETLCEVNDIAHEDLPLPEFLWVAVEKQPPYRCEVFEADYETLAVGMREVHAKINLLSRCLRDNVWPNSKLGVQQISLTSWQKKESNDATAAILEGALT